MFRPRLWLLLICVCGASFSSALGQGDGGKAFLLNARKGQVPNDTGLEDQTKLSSVNSPELGGKAVKVPLAAEDSFGVRSVSVKDWTKFARLRMDAFNPNKQAIELELNIVHSGSTDYDTRVTASIELKPGKSTVSVDLEGLKNTNGSDPEMGEVTKWYFADASKLEKTFFIGDIWLEGGDAPAEPSEEMPAEPAESAPDEVDLPRANIPAKGFRVRGTIGNSKVDLIVTPLDEPSSEKPGEDEMESSESTAPSETDDGPKKPAGLNRPQRRPIAKAPKVAKPISFDTPEADAIMSAMQILPANNAIYQDISDWPVHSNSENIIASIGADKFLRYNTDMAYMLVPPNQKKVPVKVVEYPTESDEGPFPIPDNVPIELWPVHFQRENISITLDALQRGVGDQGDDRHVIIVDPANYRLHEFWHAKKTKNGWEADGAATFDLKANISRPDGWTSADASGMAILPLVVRHDELQRGAVEHALRFTIAKSRREYVYPASHYASNDSDENLPRMGERLRLRADYDISNHSTLR